MSFFYWWNPEVIFRKHTNEVFPCKLLLSVLLVSILLWMFRFIYSVNHIIDPLLLFFPDIGNSIDVKKKEHLKAFFVISQLFIITFVFNYLEMLFPRLFSVSTVLMHFQSATGDFKFSFLLCFLLKKIFFIKELAPSIEGYIILYVFLLEKLRNELHIL